RFFVIDPPTPVIYTLSLHDALPISFLPRTGLGSPQGCCPRRTKALPLAGSRARPLVRQSQLFHPQVVHRFDHATKKQGRAIESRSEEHTSELQSRSDLVCRLLLEKK